MDDEARHRLDAQDLQLWMGDESCRSLSDREDRLSAELTEMRREHAETVAHWSDVVDRALTQISQLQALLAERDAEIAVLRAALDGQR